MKPDPIGTVAIVIVALLTVSLFVPSCSKPELSASPKVIERVRAENLSQRVRVENLQARIEKSYRLSETESIKVVIVPGYPFGERCLIYTNASSATMQCEGGLSASQQ